MTTSTTTPIEVSALHGAQQAIASYAQLLDTGRAEEVADLFTPDGVAEITGMATFAGREAIRAGYAGFTVQSPQLHLVTNTVLTSVTEDEATAVSNLAFFHRGKDGWTVELAGRYDDTLRLHEGVWKFARRVTSFFA
jgi:uncharacterized protein (TIGR02246 family)